MSYCFIMGNKINLRVHLPAWLTSMFPEAIWRIPGNEKTVYLTFDDGPVPEVTPQILEILAKHNIQATFFCVGENVAKHPDLFKQIKKAGHAVGNHTYNHLRGFKTSNAQYISNIEKADELIQSNLFRPPHGTLKKLQYNTVIRKYWLVMWDVISCDYDPGLSPRQCLNNVINFVQDGSIITFHDSIKAQQNVLDTLPKAIDFLQNEGYSFRKIEFPEKTSIHLEYKSIFPNLKKRSINRLQKGA